MPLITIERNGQIFGPYTESQLQYYLEHNQMLLNGAARPDSRPETMPRKRKSAILLAAAAAAARRFSGKEAKCAVIR